MQKEWGVKYDILCIKRGSGEGREMNDWRKTTVGEVATGFLSGGTPTTKRTEYWAGEIPWITSKWLGEKLELKDGEKFVSEEAVKKTSTKIVPKNSIIFATRVGVGKVGINRLDLAINQDLAGVLIDEKKYDLEFLAYQLRLDSIQQYIEMNKRGATIKGITRDCLEQIRLNVPPLPEQKKIAQILSTIQQAIEAQERIIQTTTELKKALMHKLFTEGLRNEPQKQTEIGPVPESWEVVELAQVIRSKLQNGAFVKKPVTGQGYLFANVVDMYRETHLDLSGLERIVATSGSISKYWLEEGGILVVRSSLKREGIGQNCVARGMSESVFYDCHLIRVQAEQHKLIPEFLSAFWRSDVGRNNLILRSKTTTMTTINQQGISRALVPIAPLVEQKEIIDALEAIDEKIVISRRKRDRLKDLFRTLLHELMTARIRVHKTEFITCQGSRG